MTAATGRCLVLGMCTLDGDEDPETEAARRALRAFAAYIDLEYHACAAQYPHVFNASAIDVIGDWNDDDGRTLGEVIETLLDAATDWETTHHTGGARAYLDHTLTIQPGGPSTRDSRPPRRRTVVENDEYAAFVRRIIRAYARRVATGDVEALADMVNLSELLDQALTDAVTGLRAHGYSWADIADRLGITRQAAHQRWGGDR
jgi:hypothetical protein